MDVISLTVWLHMVTLNGDIYVFRIVGTVFSDTQLND